MAHSRFSPEADEEDKTRGAASGSAPTVTEAGHTHAQNTRQFHKLLKGVILQRFPMILVFRIPVQRPPQPYHVYQNRSYTFVRKRYKTGSFFLKA